MDLKNIKLSELLAKYPWLPDELIKLDSRFGIIKTPVGKLMLKNATVADAVKKTGLSEEKIVSELKKLIASHGK